MSSLKQTNIAVPHKDLYSSSAQGGTAYFKLSVENIDKMQQDRKTRNSELEKKRVSFDVNNIK